MKTILFIYTNTFNPQRGGIQRVTHLLTESLLKRGYKILYLCFNREGSSDFTPPAPLYYFPNKQLISEENIKFYNNFLTEHNVDIIVNQAGLYQASKLFLDTNTDCQAKIVSVLHSNPVLYFDNLFSKEFKLKDNTISEKWKRLKRIYHYPKTRRKTWSNIVDFSKFVYTSSDFICLLSNKFEANYKRLIPDASNNKLRGIGNPNSYPKQNINLLNKNKTILFVGRLWGSEKRADRLIDIWKMLYKKYPDWELVIVGDGDLRPQLEKQSKGIPNVRFVGYQDPKPYYESASILCLTSDYEGFGMVLTEAQVHGVVPVSFNSFASVTDIIEDNKNGILVKPYSLKEYASKLGDLMKNDDKRCKMASYAMETVEKFDIDSITDEWVKLFSQL